MAPSPDPIMKPITPRASAARPAKPSRGPNVAHRGRTVSAPSNGRTSERTHERRRIAGPPSLYAFERQKFRHEKRHVQTHDAGGESVVEQVAK
jgi:hypothetical protein